MIPRYILNIGTTSSTRFKLSLLPYSSGNEIHEKTVSSGFAT